MSIWNLGGWIAVRRLRMIGTWPAPERLICAVEALRARFAIRRAVTLLQSTVVKVPMTIGWLKPVILVPVSILSELSPQHVEAIIAHELAHVRRCDYFVNLMQTVVETLFFHHPAVWWISRHVRLEREYCSDNAVVKLTADQVNYARALTEIAERRDTLPQVVVAADGGSLVGRIRRILGMERESSLLRNRSAGWSIFAFVFIVAVFAVGIGLSSHSLWAAPTSMAQPPTTARFRRFRR
jgi:beta-lactamase regulating signal transducer with metallopeptidase domain